MLQPAYRLTPPKDPKDGGPAGIVPFGRSSAPHEDLPYKVELWDAERKMVEQVLAVTASATIGYAAYFAASREFPDRLITLRHKDDIMNRSHSPSN